MESKPLVSVCIQTYKHEKYIAQCLDSILIQETSFPFEIVIGEDESPDQTREICQKYAANHPDKIQLFLRNRKDVLYVGGMPTGRSNFLKNMEACRGKYIAMCPGDDFWCDTKKLQKQVDILEKNNSISLVYTNAKIESDNKGDYIEDSVFFNEDYPLDPIKNQSFFLKNNFALLTLSVMFKREDFNIKDQQVIKHFATGDLPLYIMLSGKGDFYYMDETCVIYNDHAGGLSKTFGKVKRNLINYEKMNFLLPYIHKNNRRLFDEFNHKYIIIPTFNGLTRMLKKNENFEVSLSQFFFVKLRHLKPRYIYYIFKLILLKLRIR